MKNFVYYIFVFTCLSFFVACSNGDYVANPATNANGSINPLHPLTSSDFTWSGKDPLSANVNGTYFEAKDYIYTFDSGRNMIFASNGAKAFYLFLKDVWKGNLYNMGYKQYDISGYYTDSFGDANSYYFSDLGNSGGLYMLKNDTVLGGYISGLFYFQGINSRGQVINISNGYFNVQKWY